MKRTRKKKSSYSHKVGLPPGTLNFKGEKYTDNAELEFYAFNQEEIQYLKTKPSSVISSLKNNYNWWINLDGLHNTKAIEKIGAHFGVHPLVLEDILNTDHRPKVEEFNDYLFFTFKMFSTNELNIEYEQVSLILGKNYITTFQEKEGDVLNFLREKLQDKTSKLRTKSIDYLFYRIIDTIVDSYYLVIENLSDRIEKLEDEIYKDARPEHYKASQNLRRELITLRKAVYPLREAIYKLSKESNNALISEDTKDYLSDVYDHAVHIMESIETYRDLTSGLMDLYMTSVSNRMNEIMKVLTVISTIFIPITFIAGIYGMNFQNMPELSLKYGYPAAITLMVVIVIVMLIYFKKKKLL